MLLVYNSYPDRRDVMKVYYQILILENYCGLLNRSVVKPQSNSQLFGGLINYACLTRSMSHKRNLAFTQ